MMSNLHFLIKSLRHSVQRSTVMEFKYSEQVTPAYFKRHVCLLIGKSRNLRMCLTEENWRILKVNQCHNLSLEYSILLLYTWSMNALCLCTMYYLRVWCWKHAKYVNITVYQSVGLIRSPTLNRVFSHVNLFPEKNTYEQHHGNNLKDICDKLWSRIFIFEKTPRINQRQWVSLEILWRTLR